MILYFSISITYLLLQSEIALSSTVQWGASRATFSSLILKGCIYLNFGTRISSSITDSRLEKVRDATCLLKDISGIIYIFIVNFNADLSSFLLQLIKSLNSIIVTTPLLIYDSLLYHI